MNTAGGRGSGWVWKSARLCRRTPFKFMSMSEVPGERRGRTPSKPGAELVHTGAEAEILSSWQETAPTPASRSAPCCSSHYISLPSLLSLPRIPQGGLRDTPAHSKGGGSSPEPWARPSCNPQEGGCPPPKEHESSPPPALQTVQLPRLALSPPPSAPPPPPPPPPQQVQAAPSPPSPLPPPLPLPTLSGPDPSLDFLRAQQETANAIRELAGTLRQGLTKLSEALSALLPLLPGTPVDPLPPPLPPPPPPRPVLPPPTPKVEITPEPVSVVAAVMDRAMVAARGVIIAPRSEEGAPRPPTAPIPSHDSPPHKRRKGFPTRKRRGRWKCP